MAIKIDVMTPLVLVKVISPSGISAAAINPKELALIQSSSREKFLDFLILGISGFNISTKINDGKKIPIEASTAPEDPPNR